MGDPRRVRKKYSRPRHPWERTRIENERELISEYGLRNKKEIWKMDSILRGFKDQVKKLNAMEGAQAEREKEQLLDKLQRLGILEEGQPIDDVLGLGIRTILERRLQSVVYRKGLARSMKQARQFVVHEHITVDGQKVTVPSYLVREGEDISFAENSPFRDEMHPEIVEEKPSATGIEEESAREKDEIAEKEEKKQEEKEDEEPAEEDEASDEDEEQEEDNDEED